MSNFSNTWCTMILETLRNQIWSKVMSNFSNKPAVLEAAEGQLLNIIDRQQRHAEALGGEH